MIHLSACSPKRRFSDENKTLFPVFIVLVSVVIYAYNTPKQKPERATTLTPKEYIELVEVKKKEQLKKSAEEAAKTQTQEKTR